MNAAAEDSLEIPESRRLVLLAEVRRVMHRRGHENDSEGRAVPPLVHGNVINDVAAGTNVPCDEGEVLRGLEDVDVPLAEVRHVG